MLGLLGLFVAIVCCLGSGYAEDPLEVDAAAEVIRFLSQDRERWLHKPVSLPKLKYLDAEFRNPRADFKDVTLHGPAKLTGRGFNDFKLSLDADATLEVDTNSTIGSYTGPLRIALAATRLSLVISVWDKFEPSCRTRIEDFRILGFGGISLTRNNYRFDFNAAPGDFAKLLGFLNDNLSATNIEKFINVHKYESYICA